MRSVLVACLLLLAACSGGAAADHEPDCAPDDLTCALVVEADLEEILGEDVDVARQPTSQLGSAVAWCDRPIPAPVERADQGFAATSQANGVTVAISATALRFEGSDAELTMDALAELRQGCAWTEGEVEFRFLDELAVAGFGDEALGLLVRVRLGEVEDNAEIVIVRRDGFVVQVGMFPAQDAPALWDAVARRVDDRLIGLAGG